MSFNECLTQEAQNALFELRKVIDSAQWVVGDIANDTYDREKDSFSFTYVCAAVGYFVGKSGATIQRWARTAKFYSDDWRSLYNGLLSFEHYAIACQYQDWQARLEKAAYGGRVEEPQSVDKMIADTYRPPEDTTYQSPTAIVSFEQEEPTVQMIGKPKDTIQAIFGLIANLIEKLGFDRPKRDKIDRALQLLREALTENETI